MFKKISYFLILSLILNLATFSKAYADYEEPLVQEIDAFVTQKRRPKVEEAPEGWSIVEKAPEGWGSYLSNKTGTFIRYLGDGLRDKIHKTSGNTLRWIGEFLVDEEPTLERRLRDFWLSCDPMPDMETILTSTACALYSSTVLKKDRDGKDQNDSLGAFQVTYGYELFIKSWNQSSKTIPFEDKDSNAKYFLNGIIRALARQKVTVQSFEDIERMLLVHNIFLDNCVVTRDITEDSIIQQYFIGSKGYKLTTIGLREKVNEARKEAFMAYFRYIYEKEQNTILFK